MSFRTATAFVAVRNDNPPDLATALVGWLAGIDTEPDWCNMSSDDISQNDILIMPHKFEPPSKLPLSETTLYILLTLAPSPKHGYAIMKEVAVLSNERLMLSTGTLYGALKRLLETGWIEAVSQSSRPGTRTRRAYTLTSLGRAMLDAELVRLKTVTRMARVYIAKGSV